MYQESQLQQMCVRYFRYKYPQYLIYAVPNGGLRNSAEAKRLKEEWASLGIPSTDDFVVVVSDEEESFLKKV